MINDDEFEDQDDRQYQDYREELRRFDDPAPSWDVPLGDS